MAKRDQLTVRAKLLLMVALMNGLLVLAAAFVVARLFFVASNYANFREHTVHFSNITSVAEDLNAVRNTLNIGLRVGAGSGGVWPDNATPLLREQLSSLRVRVQLLSQDPQPDTATLVGAVGGLADEIDAALRLPGADARAVDQALAAIGDQKMPALWKTLLQSTRAELTAVDTAQAQIAHGDILALQYGLVGIGLALIVGLGISYGIFDAVIRPLGDMHRALLQVLSGNFRGVSLPQGDDEIGAIGHVIEDIKARSEHVHRLAYFDNLTGLPNRLRMAKDVGEIVRNIGDRRTFGVMLIGIDHFSAVSSGFGPRFGDEVIRQVCRRVEGRLGSDGRLYRYGGDMLGCVIRECASDKEIQALAQELTDTFSDEFRQTVHVGELDVPLSVSIGVALSLQSERPDEILTEAEAALFEAKRRGGGGRVVAVRQLSEQFRRRLKVADEIRKGIAAQEFEPFYQPVIDVERGVTVGVETLVRWRRADGRITMPSEFIFVAEESDLIRGITEQVIHKACLNGQTWREQGLPLKLAFNMSARLVQVGLQEIIVKALERSQIDPALLEMEITETVLINPHNDTEKLLLDLKKLGLRLSLDDFGSGYSSMGYLSRFPVDKIKIDATFVKSLGAGEKQREIVANMIRLAQRLNLDVVAEGIETVEQLEQLRAMGCQLMQGWLFAAALPASALPDWVRSTGSLLDGLRRKSKVTSIWGA
ncbi:MAG: GGDEF domain-containing protein [Nevskiaceae bacterium]|nr:MAG: GGDEF domain-containing protein [Nevskiaceae bacterium]